MKIGEKTLEKGGEMLTALMMSYKTKINQAFLNEDEKGLKIGLSLDIEPGKASGTFKLQAGISFTTEKVKDTFTDSVDEDQLSLFDQEKPSRLCPVTGLITQDAYCAEKCESRKEVLIPDAEREDFVQYRSCAAWSDHDTAQSVQIMLLGIEVEEAEQKERESKTATIFYRIRHKKTGEWWEGEAETPEAACILAGWNVENCEVKVRTLGEFATGWKNVEVTGKLPDPDPCTGCTHHRRKGNPKKGVAIPGAYGKCIREGGICDLMLERIGGAA